MEVVRKIKLKAEKFKPGDIISFELKDGEKVRARAVKREKNGMLFCMVDCIKREEQMDSRDTNKGGYEASNLRKKLNSDILDRFPAEIRDRMKPMGNGDLLRIPTEREIFGENKYGDSDNAEQWPCMKQVRNRIALRGDNGDWERYWLQNRYRDSASAFCRVNDFGFAYASGARFSLGVRPVFLLS